MDRGPAILLMVVPLLLVADLPELDGKPISTHLTVFIHGTVFLYGFVLAAAEVATR